MADTATKLKIILVTADKIGETGRVSFTWMGELPREQRDQLTRKPWGYLWKPREGDLSFNVWQNGGLVVGGGFGPSDTPEWQREILESLPDCSLLLTTENFEALKPILEQHGVDYERFHIDHPIFTS